MKWQDVIAAAKEGKHLWYQAPLDFRPVRVACEVRGKNPQKVRVIPPTRDCDPFWADEGHAERFTPNFENCTWRA